MVTGPIKINKELKEKYEKLFVSQVRYNSQLQRAFLDKLDIPTISESKGGGK